MLEGRTIENVRRMTDEELESEHWHHYRGSTPLVLELDDGTKVYPSKDPEGNGPGALFGENEDGEKVRFGLK